MALLLLLFFAPAAAIAIYLYCRDARGEPLKGLAGAFLSGSAAALCAWALESGFDVLILPAVKDSARLILRSFASAGLVEEGSKYAAFRLRVFDSPRFDEPFDGFVYGVMIALGFAAVESAGYAAKAFAISGGGGLATAAMIRALFTTPSHACFGIISGFFFSLAKFRPGKGGRPPYLLLALLVPALLHGSFDLLIFLRAPLAFAFLAALTAASWGVAASMVGEWGRRQEKKGNA